MKKRILFIALAAVLVLCSILFASCNSKDDTDYTAIETIGMTYENGEYKLIVSPETANIDLATKFQVSENAYYELYSLKDGETLLNSAVVSLDNGNNIFKVKIFDNNSHTSEYKINVYRKQMFTVTFNTNGGTEVNSITIEEGKPIEAPNTFKVGYDFVGWDYDFANPITSNITINAQWNAKDYKLTFDVNGTKTEVDLKYGDSYKAPEVNENGYNFLGWVYKNASFNAEGVYEYTENIAK